MSCDFLRVGTAQLGTDAATASTDSVGIANELETVDVVAATRRAYGTAAVVFVV
jgi:hypothetical protein